MRVDLHMHSNNSDGSDSVETIIDKAVKKGLEAIAITDHDNVGGLKRASEYAKGKIGFVNGIEVSTYSKMEIHILGYGVDFDNETLLEETGRLLDMRRERILKILGRLRDIKIDLPEDEVNFTCAGRLDIAKLMIKHGYVSTVPEAFNKYLGVNGSVYLPSNRLKPLDAVKLITKAGGRAVIAHPEKYMNAGILEGLITELRGHGLVGLECNYPSHSEDTTHRLRCIAKKYGLIETVGSDYHGTNGINDIGQVKFELSRSTVEMLAGHKI